MNSSRWLVALVSGWALALGTSAQTVREEPEWKEGEAVPPPAFDASRLVPVDMGVSSSTLKIGIDPQTLSIGSDGVVRYVVVASSPTGAINVMFEGIRCSAGQFRVYARHWPDTGWKQLPDSPWRSLYDAGPSKHSLALARGGVCAGPTPNRSAGHIVRSLKAQPIDRVN